MAIISGTTGNDTRIGTNADDTVTTGNGDDLLFGVRGRDWLYAGTGNDSAYGGDDADRLYGGNGRDSLFGDAGSDRLEGGNGNDVLSGGTGADSAWGGGGRDQLWGGDQADWLFGGNGDDQLGGGTGNDSLDGGGGTDSARYAGIRAGYGLHLNDDGTVTVTDLDTTNGDTGTDRLKDIEGLRFADGSRDLATPEAIGDAFTTNEDAGRQTPLLEIAAADLLANDFGQDLRILSAADIDTSATRGLLLVDTDADGVVTGLRYAPTGYQGFDLVNETYDPRLQNTDLLLDPSAVFPGDRAFQRLNVGDSDRDSFTYTATAADGSRVTATVDLTVTGANDAPLTENVSVRGEQGSRIPVTLSVFDVDSTALDVNLVTVPSQGFLFDREDAEGSSTRLQDIDGVWVFHRYFDYIPSSRSFTGIDSFTYVGVDIDEVTNLAIAVSDTSSGLVFVVPPP